MTATKYVLFLGGPQAGPEEVDANVIGVRIESYRGPKGWYRKTERLIEVWEYDALPAGTP